MPTRQNLLKVYYKPSLAEGTPCRSLLFEDELLMKVRLISGVFVECSWYIVTDRWLLPSVAGIMLTLMQVQMLLVAALSSYVSLYAAVFSRQA